MYQEEVKNKYTNKIMESYFNTKELRDALVYEALSWEGTPFMLNSRIKGRGVSCHNLAYGIWEHFEELNFESPIGTGRAHDHKMLSQIVDFFKDKEQCYTFDPDVERLQTGDTIGFRTKSGQAHIGMYLGMVERQNHTIISALPNFGVSRSNLYDGTFADAVVAGFRLKPKRLW